MPKPNKGQNQHQPPIVVIQNNCINIFSFNQISLDSINVIIFFMNIAYFAGVSAFGISFGIIICLFWTLSWSGYGNHNKWTSQDKEMYASYIGNHCRKNRRGRNSNKNVNLLAQSNVDMDWKLGLRAVLGHNVKKSLASYDSHTFSHLSSQYPISDIDERPFGNCNFSHVPSHKELNFNPFLNDKKKLKKEGITKEKSAVIGRNHDKRGKCRSRDDIDEDWDISVSVSEKSSLPPKRRTKKKRQRSGTRKTSYCKQNMQEEENKNSISKHYNEQRRHSSKDVDKKAVSGSNDNADKIEHKHRSDSKTRSKFSLLDEPDVFIKKYEHSKPQWTCSKWATENRNKNTQGSSASQWAYEVYSDTCLNPAINDLQRGIRSQRGNEEDLCDIPDDHQRETNQGSLGFRQPALCSANITNLPADKPFNLAECNNGAPSVWKMPFLVANYSPMIADQAEGEPRQLAGTMRSQVSGSENCHSNIDTIDRAINTIHNGRRDHRMPAENKSNKGAEDKDDSQETSTNIDSCDLGKYKQDVYIKKSKQETCLNQTNRTKERHNKLLENQQSSSRVREGTEMPASEIPSMKSQSSVDEKLIRTVHSIKVDIESVFDRINSLDANKDDSVVKTSLSLKDSVGNVLAQAKAAQHNSSATHVINAAEIIKNALKTLTTFKAKFAVKSWIDTSDSSKTTRDIQIIYKISSKTTLTDDDKSIINAICLRKTEEEIMAVPYDSESTSPSIRQKGFSDPCSSDNSKDVGNAFSDQLRAGRSNKKDVEESGAEIKGFALPSEEFKSASENNLFGHDQQRQMAISNELISSEINRLSSFECLENDLTKAESSLSKNYQLAKQTKVKKSSDLQEMPNSLCNISELTENVVAALDSNKEPSLESFGKLVSACKEIQEAQQSKALERQTTESYDAAISSGYVKTRETTELLLPDSGTSVNCQREECIQIQQNEIREPPTNKATKNTASEVLDNNAVSMLNASIIKLYEEVSKLRVKLETTTEKPTALLSPKADKRKSRSNETSKKKKRSKDSSSMSIKSSSSTQSSRASSRGYKAACDDDNRSSRKGHYFGVLPVYSAMQSAAGEHMSKTELTTSPTSAIQQYCCSFRKYDTHTPETISEYYDKKLKLMEQVPQEISDTFYLEYEPQNISPALYIEHKSLNPSPASYMEVEDDDSSVASYAKQTLGPQETSDTKQNFQYFEKNLSRCVGSGSLQEKADAGSDKYWSEFSSVPPSKQKIIEAMNYQYEESDGSGVIGGGKFDHADVIDSLFLGEQSHSGIVQEYLSREKQSIVEYTSNTLIAEGIGLQLNEIAATMDSVSDKLDCHLRNNNEFSDPKGDFGKYNLKQIEPNNQADSTKNNDSGLLTVHCHTNENSGTATENTQHYSKDSENPCDINLIAKEEHNTDRSNTFVPVVSDDNEEKINLPASASEHNARLDVNSKLNSNRPTLPCSNSAMNYSNENLPSVSKENLHQSSSEDKSEQTGEPVKTPTPPMWSDSEESLGKNEEDYIASLHIPRIVQCVKDMFFGSTKALSKEAIHQSPKPYNWQSGTSISSKGMSSNNSEMTHSDSRCQTTASDTDDDVVSVFSSTWRRQSYNGNVKEDDSDAASCPLQHNYIFRKKERRINTESRESPSKEPLKKTMPSEVDDTNEESPHYSDCSWAGKDIGNYNFVGSNILLTSNPFIQCRSMGYLPAFKNVEETDKTVRHYCDAINSNTSKRLNSLDSRCASIAQTASGEDCSSARICNSSSEDADEVIVEYGRAPFLENCSSPAQNEWSSSQCTGCFPKWQSQMTPSPMLARYREDDILPYCESTIQQRRPCYVDHCGFRQKRCDNFENGLCGQERGLKSETNHDTVAHKSERPGVNDNNFTHDITRKEDVIGLNDSAKHYEKLCSTTDMFYANEGLMDTVPFECSKKLDSSVSKHLFTSIDVSETDLYNSCSNIRSVDYEKGGQMRHYKQEPRRDQAAHAKEEAQKSKAVYEDALEKSNKDVAEDDEERVSVSDDENTDIDAVSDDMSMEDDERESWYKTTDDESNS